MKAPRRARLPASRPFTLRIDDLAPGGDGVGHIEIDGVRRAVFVAAAAVGDRVSVEVDVRSRPARGRRLELLEAGPGRVAAPCPTVDECGACDWMHLADAAQRTAREDHLRRALPAALRDHPITVHAAGPPLGYRTRARLHVRASGGRAIVGPHRPGSQHVVDLTYCVVLDPALEPSIRLLAELIEAASGTGEASVALGRDRKPVLDLRWSGRLPAVFYARLEEAVTLGTWAGASVHAGEVARPAVVGDPTPWTVGADGAPLALAPGGFAQASDASNLGLGRRVLDLARALAPADGTVVELHAGSGNFTVLLAREFARVTAIEANELACAAARQNLEARGLAAKVTCADAEAFAIPRRAELVVLDPPRRGARQACAAIAEASAKAVLYVSCDPPTLGRDLDVLAARYEPVAIESFGMFPGTSHAEAVVALRRRRSHT